MIHKTYKDGILYNGDCLKVLSKLIKQDIKVDLICCDPPYRVISGGAEGYREMYKGSILESNDGKLFEHNDLDFDRWLKLCYKILKDGGDFYCMTNLLNLFKIYEKAISYGFKLHNLLVWKKNNANANRWYMKNCEYVLFFYKGKAKNINDMGSMTVHEFNNIIGNKLHPTEKPVSLMEYYISNSSDKGQLVLDPCCGSGSTLIACRNLNRKFIGIELDEKYYKVCKKRLNTKVKSIFN